MTDQETGMDYMSMPTAKKLEKSIESFDKIIIDFIDQYGARGKKKGLISIKTLNYYFGEDHFHCDPRTMRRWGIKEHMKRNYDSIKYKNRKGFLVDIEEFIKERIEEDKETDLSEKHLKKLPYYIPKDKEEK